MDSGMAHSDPIGDLLITGGRVYTADYRSPWAEAVLLRGDRIAYVGRASEARAAAAPGAEHVHLHGGLVLPGLNDSHIHTDWGGDALQMLDLADVVTLEELQERLRRYAAQHPEREWIEGTGLGYEALFAEPVPRLALDAAVADRPVYLRALDWHTAWSNTHALARAGILDGAAVPLPNEVVLDEVGRASGMLKERLAFTLVEHCIPVPSPAEAEARLLEAMRYLNRMGVTSVQNMHGDPQLFARYQALGERQTVRALHYMRLHEDTLPATLEEFAAMARRYRSGWNRVNGVKFFIDGVVESRTAMMLAPYADGSGDLGVPDMDPAIYRELVLASDRLGMQIATHAIGDRGVRTALDAYEGAMEANGTRGRHRHRVEHIEVLHWDDLARFARSGITASMQPLHCAPTIDPDQTPYSALLGPERLPNAFAWRSLLESGAHLSFGSDWPIVTPDAMQGLHVALTRTSTGGLPRGGYQPQQCLTLAQALDAYTCGAAYAEFQEDEKGRLQPGMLADVAVLSRDPFSAGTESILGTEVWLTVVGGRAVYRHPTVG
jgi:predicted amidohydrolase YtcJ